MKTTPFTDYHIAAGARMAEFAGYNMPIEFSGIADEHNTVRNAVGLFDVSHMGEIWVKGANALPFLQKVTSNDVAALYDGKAQYSCFPNGKGGIVDDLLVYRIDAQTYLLVVNASNIEKDWEHLCKFAPEFNITPGKELYNASDEIAQLAVQGPLAMKLVQKLCPEPIEDMEYYTFKKTEIAGIKDAILSITGYTGSGGCEIYVANEDAPKLWEAIWKAGEEFGLKNIGLGARDTLRLEMGFCLYGNDLDDTTSPIEAGLGWITKFVDNKDFVDRAYMEAQKAEGVKRKLVGFEMIDRGIPRHGYEIGDADGNIIGVVTSGTQAPGLKKAIGMAYVAAGHSKVGTEIYVIVRGKAIKAQIVKMPFK
ncbi:Aminomethyltransferase (glycine cleavage system T protein) [Mucinivorans hirudinis]|uniref:Aminomethyltransferase n=1 Tax=Mucinivorans hirudinis TaxID=1433126 RepID=A0A060R798_9BACT|nr:Aminomethyltransferase (glycine cleavage system T protein) [Mucinivorans hirudinis]